MIEILPNSIHWLFFITVISTLVLFFLSNKNSNKIMLLLVIWCIVQSVLAYRGFYQDTQTVPPKFILVLIPSTLMIVFGILPNQRNYRIKNRKIKVSTFLHTVRIPVEITLYSLFLHKLIPEALTFEGRNFDILAGLSAPIIGYLYLKNKIGVNVILTWNVICLFLVLFVLFNGILSAELPFQQFGFEQPNVAIKYFPFVLLPALIVPLVIYTHIIDILKLLNEKASR